MLLLLPLKVLVRLTRFCQFPEVLMVPFCGLIQITRTSKSDQHSVFLFVINNKDGRQQFPSISPKWQWVVGYLWAFPTYLQSLKRGARIFQWRSFILNIKQIIIQLVHSHLGVQIGCRNETCGLFGAHFFLQNVAEIFSFVPILFRSTFHDI